jgi:1-acyl-sn-glycerol-3-phosphate acyltransferase
VAALYRDLNVACVPVATNSGVHWPPRGLTRTPGEIVVKFLPPIAPGLSRQEFMKELEKRIEEASSALRTR